MAASGTSRTTVRSSGVRIVPLQRIPCKGFTPVHGTRSASPGKQCSLQTHRKAVPSAGGSLSFASNGQPTTNRMESKYNQYSTGRYPPNYAADWSFTAAPTSDTSTVDSASLLPAERVRAQRSTPSRAPRRKIAEDAQTMSEPPHAIMRSVSSAPLADRVGQSTSLGVVAIDRYVPGPRSTAPNEKIRRPTVASLRIDLTVPRRTEAPRVSLEDLDPLGAPCSTTGSEDFRPLASTMTTPNLRIQHAGHHLRASDIFLGGLSKRTEVLEMVRNVAIWILVLFGTGTIMSGVIATILLRNGSYMFTGSMLGSVLTTVGLLLAIYCTDGTDKQLRLIGHRCNYN